MKKLFAFLVISLVGLLYWQPVFAEVSQIERIDNFQADIKINQDSSLVVTETIEYNFGNSQHHGIYRHIPYKYKRSGTNYNVRLTVQSVVDEEGVGWPYTVSKISGQVNIKIGDPDTYVSGLQTYIITYLAARVVNYFESHDELFWNITGTEWEVPIAQASATISLPGQLSPEDEIKVTCFTGGFGSKEQDCNYTIAEQLVEVSAIGGFSSYEGLTVVMGWPKNLVIKTGIWQQIKWFLADNWSIAVPLAVLIVMFYLWYTRGRDPRVRKTIIPYYEPPHQMSAGELGTVIDEKVDLKDVSAGIIQLAVKGYIKMKELEKEKLLGKGRDYEFIKMREPDEKLTQFEKEIMKGIFDVGKIRTVSSLKNKFYVHLKKIKKSMYSQVVMNGYFPTNPEKVRLTYGVISAFIFPFGFFIIVIFGNVIVGVSTIVAGVIAVILSRVMPRKTKKGAATHKQILGFKWFLSVAEKDRLKFHNAPEKSPKQFEKFLPYAMVLGVEKEWSEQFKDMYVTPPEWYEGRAGAAFGAWYLASSLSSMSNNLNSAMVAAPRGTSTAGFGGSGFGGGGFSGGGFGGGGGGSW